MEGLVTTLKRFAPFLEELRKKLVISAGVFLAFFLGGFFSAAMILRKFVHFFKLEGVTIAATSPFQFADVAVDVGLFFALLITIPLFTYQIFTFMFPGLTKRERRSLLLSIPLSLALFGAGFLYGFLILYYSFELFANINTSIGIENFWDLGRYLSQLFLTSSLLGLLFQFPLAITLLCKLNVLNERTLREKRRVAILIVVVIVSLLPPTDGVSLLAMSVPLVLLYEATILANKRNTHYVWTRN